MSATANPATPAPPRRASFGLRVLIGIGAGLVLGLTAGAIGPAADGSPNAIAQLLALVGSSFVQLLKVLVPPLIFAAIVASIARLRTLNNAARLAGQTLLWFALTALLAVLTGIALGLALEPGVHAGVSAASATAPKSVGTWLDFTRSLVPANFLGLSASSKLTEGAVSTGLEFNVLQIVVMAIALGFAALRSGEAGERLLDGVGQVLVVLRRLLGWLVQLAPYGSAGLIGNAVVKYGWDTLGSIAQFALAVYLGLGIVLFVIYPLLLKAHGLSPLRFFAKAWPAIELAFVTRSSVAALPVAEAITTQRLGVPEAYAAFAVPVGATTKMDGCAAIYPAVAAIFIAQFYGLTLDPAQYLLIVLVSVLGSAATAGVTGALVMLTLTLTTLGLPLEGAGLLLAIDPILDMGRTAVNVAGQILIPVIVARREGLLDRAAYDADATGELAIG
ncbi:dicarboxylate/amino acid:cation symporter [Novosphingobium piscinae]|uniref:Dicarboxylate/amino acid:cation symporter n=1 Tax=Novosphingobium piscinae TaxID=1507448 RepID=A0A7X1G033_9SPHN|nr:dicarboxylate/amino acid:cation symporter [Novosphingobium piscinae]MBC2670190.1 dicarboxylate/amino acid:cation symporter [Novosphingobium piscinae]